MEKLIYNLPKCGTVYENGYEWTLYECPECGEGIQQKNVFRGKCPECKEKIVSGI